MGMYTELLLKCSVNDKHPKYTALAKAVSGDGEIPLGTSRQRMVFCSGSHYHHPEATTSLVGAYLFARFDIKNYENDIEALLVWLFELVDECEGTCVGWCWYEEDDLPTLLVMGASAIEKRATKTGGVLT